MEAPNISRFRIGSVLMLLFALLVGCNQVDRESSADASLDDLSGDWFGLRHKGGIYYISMKIEDDDAFLFSMQSDFVSRGDSPSKSLRGRVESAEGIVKFHFDDSSEIAPSLKSWRLRKVDDVDYLIRASSTPENIDLYSVLIFERDDVVLDDFLNRISIE